MLNAQWCVEKNYFFAFESDCYNTLNGEYMFTLLQYWPLNLKMTESVIDSVIVNTIINIDDFLCSNGSSKKQKSANNEK